MDYFVFYVTYLHKRIHFLVGVHEDPTHYDVGVVSVLRGLFIKDLYPSPCLYPLSPSLPFSLLRCLQSDEGSVEKDPT